MVDQNGYHGLLTRRSLQTPAVPGTETAALAGRPWVSSSLERVVRATRGLLRAGRAAAPGRGSNCCRFVEEALTEHARAAGAQEGGKRWARPSEAPPRGRPIPTGVPYGGRTQPRSDTSPGPPVLGYSRSRSLRTARNVHSISLD